MRKFYGVKLQVQTTSSEKGSSSITVWLYTRSSFPSTPFISPVMAIVSMLRPLHFFVGDSSSHEYSAPSLAMTSPLRSVSSLFRFSVLTVTLRLRFPPLPLTCSLSSTTTAVSFLARGLRGVLFGVVLFSLFWELATEKCPQPLALARVRILHRRSVIARAVGTSPWSLARLDVRTRSAS